MKEIARKIYDNNFYLYGLGFVSALFFLFLSYRDLSDFITREAVVGYSLLTVLLTGGLFISEFTNPIKTVSEEEYQEDNSNQINQPTTQFTQAQNEIEEENERVIYEWDEEEFEEEIPPVLKNETPAKKELV